MRLSSGNEHVRDTMQRRFEAEEQSVGSATASNGPEDAYPTQHSAVLAPPVRRRTPVY